MEKWLGLIFALVVFGVAVGMLRLITSRANALRTKRVDIVPAPPGLLPLLAHRDQPSTSSLEDALSTASGCGGGGTIYAKEDRGGIAWYRYVPDRIDLDASWKPTVSLHVVSGGSHRLAFVLYENGTILFAREGPSDFWSVALTPAELAATRNRLDPSLAAAKKMRRAYGRQSERRVLLAQGERLELVEAIPALEHFSDPRAVRWSPPTVELVMTPTNETAGALWPARWPPWGDSTIETDPAGRLHVHLPRTESGTVLSLLHAQAPIDLGGQAWRITMRHPLPNERALFLSP